MFRFEKKLYPSSWQDGDSWRLVWILTRGAGAAVLILGFYLSQREIINTPLRFRLLATSTFASTLLSFILIAVYRDLSAIQREQSMIMKKQEDLMQLEYQPKIAINGIQATDDDRLALTIKNVGKDLAEDIHIVVHGQVETEKHSFELSKSQPVRNDEKTVLYRPQPKPLIYPEGRDIARDPIVEGGILEVNSEALYVCSPMFMKADDWRDPTSWKGKGIGDTVETLDELGATQINLQFSLVYRGVTDEVFVKIIGALVLELSQSDEIAEVMKELSDSPSPPGLSIGPGGRPDSGEWTLEEVLNRGLFHGGTFATKFSKAEIIKGLESQSGFINFQNNDSEDNSNL
jgi:hypothetical protein